VLPLNPWSSSQLVRRQKYIRSVGSFEFFNVLERFTKAHAVFFIGEVLYFLFIPKLRALARCCSCFILEITQF
jgi:hypothetical protein